ncbi:uncharacterized protein IL334_002119 [Kwoniella shivajii]|uniref:SH3 domain-containing protein n=1 Tax=Kwoniella shivajii TaxID=564305 RepID=A0ABZ1CU37_9TREE|nr:hypothetical protein IL334_002119 [Kwoniella shivajii]
MISSILLTTLPIPSLILMLIFTLYHLTPLLTLLPNLTPSLQKLSNIIPHPKKGRNLPREFFNLPPRPGSPLSSDQDHSLRGRLGVRGGLMIILLVESITSLISGWIFISSTSTSTSTVHKWGLVATSLILIPSTITWLSIYTILSKPSAIHDRHQTSSSSSPSSFKRFDLRSKIFRNGGITHSTLFPRILPLSITCSILVIVISSSLPSEHGGYAILGYTSLCLSIILGCGMVGMWRMVYKPREGLIRLRGESRISLYEKERLKTLSPDTESTYRVSNEIQINDGQDIERIRDSSWISSPSRPPTPVSSFDYSSPHGTISTMDNSRDTSAYKTPKSKMSNSSFAASASFAMPQAQSSNHNAFSAALASTSGSATTLVSPSHEAISASRTAASEVMNDKSWLTEPTNSPASISSWSFPPTPEPERAITRNRSPSPSTVPFSIEIECQNGKRDPNLPKPRPDETGRNGDRTVQPNKSSHNTTIFSSPGSGSGIVSMDASILADYSPNPLHPLPPRGFESLTSYPLSPDQLESRTSLVTRMTGLQSRDTLAMIPVERGSSTWTLQTYHSANGNDPYKTPDHKSSRAKKVLSTNERRAPPPPPMPIDMPLPPTPTFARSSTLFDVQGKDSMELLLGYGDWVQVEREEEALEDWGRGSKGVGFLAVVTVLSCYALSVPMLTYGSTDMPIVLYLVSILLPSPILALTSVLLRYRPLSCSNTRSEKVSSKTTSTSAHRSLALRSESQLSLPMSISLKLTPPAPRRASTVNLASPTLSKIIGPRPSLTTFMGSGKSPERRHTVYGGLTMKDLEAEEAMRKTLARRSGDVWISSGHAIEGGGILSRATEMLKPVPAMRVLEDAVKTKESIKPKSLRDSVFSMVSKRASSLFQQNRADDVRSSQFEDADNETSRNYIQASPARSNIAISIIGPSPEKRRSTARTQSSYSTDDVEEGTGIDVSYQTAEIGMAKRGRMSNGPMFIFGKNDERGKATEEGYELDWLTAGVLPNLVPSIRFGDDIRIEPAPRSAPPTSTTHKRASGIQETPKSRSRPASDIPISLPQEDEDCEVTMPSFRQSSFKQSTPHNRQHTHTRSYSSSIDFTLPSEYFTAESATSASRELRQRNIGLGRSDTIESKRTIPHKPSFGLPKLDKDNDFEVEMRKSFDDLSRPNFDDDGDLEETPTGIDLPPIPAKLTHRPSLSRVSEHTEEPTLSSSSISLTGTQGTSVILSQSALDDMHLALTLASSTPASKRPKSSDASGDISVMNSILTNDEDLEEMERMMAMDTPTRTEFVISPPPSTYDGTGTSGRDSRASERSISTIATATSSYSTTTNSTSFENTSPAPPVPTLPMEYRQPTYLTPVYSHPHPPPLDHVTSSTHPYQNQNRKSFQMPIVNSHPPVQSLLPSKSTETLHSTTSSSSLSSSFQTPKSKSKLNHQQSKKELKLVKALEERNIQPRSQTSLEIPIRKQPENTLVDKRGLRPLTILADSNSNNLESGLRRPVTADSKAQQQKRFSVHQQQQQDDQRKSSTSKGKISDGSASAGKENVTTRKGSKPSSGPGTGIRGLRA